jgi:hypothetical protein
MAVGDVGARHAGEGVDERRASGAFHTVWRTPSAVVRS